MSSWDRQAVLDKYNALFDEAGDEVALIKMLGSPTHLAINLANSYVPGPAPAAVAAPEEDNPFAEPAEAPAPVEEALPEQPEELPGEAPAPARRVRAFGLIVSIIFGLVIGLPVAVVLICIGIPVLAFILYDIIRRQRYAARESQKTAQLEAELERLRALTAQQGKE